VRETLRKEVDLRSVGTEFVDVSQVPPDNPSNAYRERVNANGSPSEAVAAGYVWTPGTELVRHANGDGHGGRGRRGEREPVEGRHA